MFAKVLRFIPDGRDKVVTINTDNVSFTQPHDMVSNDRGGKVGAGRVFIKMTDGSELIVPEGEWQRVFERLQKSEEEE